MRILVHVCATSLGVTQSSTVIDQLPVGTRIPAAQVDQLPGTALPVRDSDAASAGHPSPPDGLPEEIRRAWVVLAKSGHAPTADEIAVQIGPEAMMRMFGQPVLPISVITLLNLEPAK